MEFRKSTITAAIAAIATVPSIASADQINMNFNGLFSLGDTAGVIQVNSDSALESGYRTPVTGTGTFDTTSGAGTAVIDAFSFFGSGLASVTNTTFQAIGDGIGGPGPYVAGLMGFNWGGNLGIPVTAVFDASGFFSSIGATTTWTVGAGCAACATSATAAWTITIPVVGTFTGSIGAVPMGMTNFNTAGTTLGSLFPLVDDGVAGSPMTTTPFLGFNANFDFTTINANTFVTVPVPAAAWLFGSGLIGLAGVARRGRKS